MNTDHARCPVKVWEPPQYTHSHRCDRPIKRLGLCGVHARSLEIRLDASEEMLRQLQREAKGGEA